MKFFNSLGFSRLDGYLIILALFCPIILFMSCVMCASFLPFVDDYDDMDVSFEECYQDSQLEAKDFVGTWVDTALPTVTTLRFEDDSTVTMTTADYFLEPAFRIETLEGAEDGFLEPRKIVQELVKKWASKDGVNEVTGVYEIRSEEGKVQSVDVDWLTVNGNSVSDEQIKLTSTFDVRYATDEQRDVMQMWTSYERSCWHFHKEP